MKNKVAIFSQNQKKLDESIFILQDEYNLKIQAQFTKIELFESLLKQNALKYNVLLIISTDTELIEQIITLHLKYKRYKDVWLISDKPFPRFRGVQVHRVINPICLNKCVDNSLKKTSTTPVSSYILIDKTDIINLLNMSSIIDRTESTHYKLKSHLFIILNKKKIKLFNQDDKLTLDDFEGINRKVKKAEELNMELKFAISRVTFNWVVDFVTKNESLLNNIQHKEALIKITNVKKTISKLNQKERKKYKNKAIEYVNLKSELQESSEIKLLVTAEYKQHKEMIDNSILTAQNQANNIKTKGLLRKFVKDSNKIKQLIDKNGDEGFYNIRCKRIAQIASYLAIRKGIPNGIPKLINTAHVADMMLKSYPEFLLIHSKEELNKAINKYNLSEAEIELINIHSFITSQIVERHYTTQGRTAGTLDEDYFKITEQHHYLEKKEYIGDSIKENKNHIKPLSAIYIIALSFVDYHLDCVLNDRPFKINIAFCLLKSRFSSRIFTVYIDMLQKELMP